MTIEFTLICHGLTPDEAQAMFNSRPGVEVQFRDQDWRVSYGFPNGILDLMYLADFNAEPAFSNHVRSLIAYVQEHCGEPDKLEWLISLVDGSAFESEFKGGTFAMTVLPEPDLSRNDPRKQAIEEWANKLNAIITMPTGIYGPDFRPILAQPESSKPWWKRW